MSPACCQACSPRYIHSTSCCTGRSSTDDTRYSCQWRNRKYQEVLEVQRGQQIRQGQWVQRGRQVRMSQWFQRQKTQKHSGV